MTIFDSIKYPISCPPTAHELMALPDPIFYMWVSHYYKFIEIYDRTWVANAVASAEFNGDPNLLQNMVDHLKRLIKNYDDI